MEILETKPWQCKNTAEEYKNKMRKVQSWVQGKDKHKEWGLWDDLDIPDENIASENLAKRVNYTPKNKGNILVSDKGNIRPNDLADFKMNAVVYLNIHSEKHVQGVNDPTFFPEKAPSEDQNMSLDCSPSPSAFKANEINRLDSSCLLEKMFEKKQNKRRNTSHPQPWFKVNLCNSTKNIVVFVDEQEGEDDDYSDSSISL